MNKLLSIILLTFWAYMTLNADSTKQSQEIETPDVESRLPNVIKELRQDAIIVYEDGVEDLIMQFKYETNIRHFCRLIPLPSKPEIKKVTFSAFPALKFYTGEKLYKSPVDIFIKDLGYYELLGRKNTVFGDFRLGDYTIELLNPSNLNDLKDWFEKNNYNTFSRDLELYKPYIDKNYYFAALKIKLDEHTANKKNGIFNGIIFPCHFKFKTEKPFYPLLPLPEQKETKLNLHLFSRNIYTDSFFLPLNDDVKSKEYFDLSVKRTVPGSSSNHSFVEELNEIGSISYSYYTDLLPSIKYEIPRAIPGEWYCSRFIKEILWNDSPPSLSFRDDNGMISENLKKLINQLNQKGFKTESKTFSFKIPDTIIPEKNFSDYLKNFIANREDLHKNSEYYLKPLRRILSKEKLDEDMVNILVKFNLISKFLWWNFPEEEQRKNVLLDLLPNCDFYWMTNYHRGLPWLILEYPCFRPCLVKSLENPLSETYRHIRGNGNFSGGNRFRFNKDGSDFYFDINAYKRFTVGGDESYERIVNIPQEDLPKENELLQLTALRYMDIYKDPIAFEKLQKWLESEKYRRSALVMMARSINNNIASTGSQEKCIRGYICKSAFDKKEQNLKLIRPFLNDNIDYCQIWAERILALMGDEKSIDYFIKKLVSNKESQDRISLVAAANCKSPRYAQTILKLLKNKNAKIAENKFLIQFASAYLDYPEIKNIVLTEKHLPKLYGIRDTVLDKVNPWLEEKIKNSDNDPNIRLYQLAFVQYVNHLNRHRIDNEFANILQDPRLKLETLQAFDKYGKTIPYYVLDRYSRGPALYATNLFPLVDFISKFDDKIIADTELGKWSRTRLLTGIREIYHPKRVELAKKIIEIIDKKNFPNEKAKLKFLRSFFCDHRIDYRRNLFLVAVKPLYNENIIRQNLNKTQDPIGKKLCKGMLKVNRKYWTKKYFSGEGYQSSRLEKEEFFKAKNSFIKNINIYQDVDKNIVSTGIYHYYVVKDDLKDYRIEKFIPKTDDIENLLLRFTIIKDNKGCLLELKNMLETKKERNPREKYLLIEVNDALRSIYLDENR